MNQEHTNLSKLQSPGSRGRQHDLGKALWVSKGRGSLKDPTHDSVLANLYTKDAGN